MTLQQLKAALDRFSPAKIRFVATVVESLDNPPRVSIREPGTWLTKSSDWIEYFGLALSVHHGTTPEPLGMKPFEAVFRNACRAIDWGVASPGSANQRFLDIVVTADGDTKRLSLKSTAAKRLSETSVHISKLTEAAWVQDTRTARSRRDRLRELFFEYCRAVDSIVILRAFRDDAEKAPGRYELVEIPTTIFASVQSAGLSRFGSDAPTIDCEVDGRVAAVVAVDRSDAKITVRRIKTWACTVHAEWLRDDQGSELA